VNEFLLACFEQQGEDKTITIDGYIDVEAYSETALMAAVAKQPVSVAIEASAWDFQLYSEVIAKNPRTSFFLLLYFVLAKSSFPGVYHG
jgi:hypothetical protein